MDNYLRITVLIAIALILLFLLFANKKHVSQSTRDTDEEMPMIFSDLKDDFDREFLMKTEPHFEETQSSFALDEKPDDLFLTKPTASVNLPTLLTLSVMAKPRSSFASYDLLQAISASGMQFGAMNIFHYYQENDGRKETLFSLASANEPGEFDLNKMGEFSCTGLLLFMKLDRVEEPQFAFQKMLEVAEQLAEDLDGDMKADPRTPWTDEISRQYQEKIADLESV